MTLVDSLVVAFYFFAVFGIGIYASNVQRSLKDFFLGGRNVPWWAAMFSGVATIFSGVSYLGGPGLAFASNYNIQGRVAQIVR
jgi:SSS family solute:Na+ symporter